MEVTRERAGMLGKNQVKEGMPAGMLELYFVDNEERHTQICILQGTFRQHYENELGRPKPAVGDMVHSYSNLQKKKKIEA